jgi:hypothetical protein
MQAAKAAFVRIAAPFQGVEFWQSIVNQVQVSASEGET